MKSVLFFLFAICSFSNWAQVNQNSRIVFGGIGTNTDAINTSNAWSIGYINSASESKYRWGLDLSAEGISVDSTFNQNQELVTAYSFNFLWGKDISDNISILGLIGFRESSQECEYQSFIGYQCYADSEPDTSFDINYGGLLLYQFQHVAVGFRFTGESKQLIFGFKY